MKHTYDRLNVIATPEHIHGVLTAEEYEKIHKAHMQTLQRARPALQFPDPHDAESGAVVHVSGGKWVVYCECNNAPSAHPEWGVARCLDCGAVYRELKWPEHLKELQALLVQRPTINRHWTPAETLEDVRDENKRRGPKEKT